MEIIDFDIFSAQYFLKKFSNIKNLHNLRTHNEL
jgi:hypothetical protein